MYIFLRGVSGSELEQVTDFLYNGEAFITQDEMKQFFETAEILQVKGLQEDWQGIGKNIKIELTPEFEDSNNEYENADHASLNNIANQETIVGASIIHNNDSVYDTFDEEIPGIDANKELDHQIAEMIEKTEDGKWKCKVCDKIAQRKVQVRRHAEIHIEGLSFTCDVCSKTCSTRQYLREHISKSHTGVFSCTVCDKTGMNRNSYHKHNNRYHRNSFIICRKNIFNETKSKKVFFF